MKYIAHIDIDRWLPKVELEEALKEALIRYLAPDSIDTPVVDVQIEERSWNHDDY